MDIFSFEDYRKYLLALIKDMPKEGHGMFRKMAHHLQINSVVVSQIFAGKRHLSEEQALELADFFGLTKVERDYFLLLVQQDRAGTHKLRTLYKEKINELKVKAQKLNERLSVDKNLSDEQKSIFYSSWYYSAIRLMTDISAKRDINIIADELQLPIGTVKRVVDFLLKNKLCIEENGKIKMGPQTTHIGADSPLVNRHHANWRTKALQRMDQLQEIDLFYTGPMVISAGAYDQIRNDLIKFLEKVRKHAVASKSEELTCLNIDLFKI
jgi:uncharacterized protein (TIGR02147 family)